VIAERKGLDGISRAVRVFAVRSCYVFALSLSCATPKEPPATPGIEADRAATAVDPQSDAQAAVEPSVPVSASASPSQAAAAKPADTPSKTCGDSASAFGFTRVSTDVVTSLSTGKAGHVALLSNLRAKVYDGKTFRTIEPDLTAAPGLNVSIFFGRDNRPRLMGYADDGRGGLEQRYLRERGGRWQKAADELGALGTAKGLYGVLGHDDPEVVCSPKRSCIVKRVTGWVSVPAHDAPLPIVLSGGTAWALARDRVLRLGETGWLELEPPRAFEQPSALLGAAPSASATRELWVLERGGAALARRHDGVWSVSPAPVRNAKAIAGRSERDFWIVGDGGVVHFDGSSFRCASDAPGPLASVALADGAVWVGGGAGLFRLEAAK
jgi:hypothetical protein